MRSRRVGSSWSDTEISSAQLQALELHNTNLQVSCPLVYVISTCRFFFSGEWWNQTEGQPGRMCMTEGQPGRMCTNWEWKSANPGNDVCLVSTWLRHFSGHFTGRSGIVTTHKCQCQPYIYVSSLDMPEIFVFSLPPSYQVFRRCPLPGSIDLHFHWSSSSSYSAYAWYIHHHHYIEHVKNTLVLFITRPMLILISNSLTSVYSVLSFIIFDAADWKPKSC